MRKLSSKRLIAVGFAATMVPATAFAAPCSASGNGGVVSSAGSMDRFAFALAGCEGTSTDVFASEQLRSYDAPRATDVITSSELYAMSEPVVSARRQRVGQNGTFSARRNYDALVQAAAREHDIDPDLLHAIMAVESGSNARARSHAGAIGLMQVMPATGRRFGAIDLYDPTINMRAAASYLKVLQRMFGNDLSLVLAAYNAGEGAVQKYGRRIPPYRETQNYVRNVLARYDQFIQARSSTIASLSQ